MGFQAVGRVCVFKAQTHTDRGWPPWIWDLRKWDVPWESSQPLLEMQRPGPYPGPDLGRDGDPELMMLWERTYIEGSLGTRLCSKCCGCIISLNPYDVTLWFLPRVELRVARPGEEPVLGQNCWTRKQETPIWAVILLVDLPPNRTNIYRCVHEC